MQRTPEPELMDEAEQARAYAEADFGETDDLWVALFLERFGPARGEVVDLGCGPGNLTFRLAAACPEARVTGVDGAAAMLALAEARRRSGVPGAERVRFTHALLPAPELPAGAFDAVTSNSLLHHLHDPGVLWREIRRLARPGAAVLVADLRRPATPDEADRLTAIYAGDAPEVLRRDFHASLHAAFEPGEIRAQLSEAGLDLEIALPTDRHVVIRGRL